MLKLYPLKDTSAEKFRRLFSSYYNEIDADEDTDHLVDEYIIADYKAGLLFVDLLDDGDDTVGFIIWQTDDITNDFNFKEGWGDIREIYVVPAARGKGLGKFMLYAAEMKLYERGVRQVYTLPLEQAENFFAACGYKDSGEYHCDLDCPVYVKDKLNENCKCK